MNLIPTRTALVQAFNQAFAQAFPAVPLVFDNQPFDRNNPPPFFVEVEVEFSQGTQFNLSCSPLTRVAGAVIVTAVAREGTGSLKGLEILGWAGTFLGYARFGDAVMKAPSPHTPHKAKGWYSQALEVEFHADV